MTPRQTRTALVVMMVSAGPMLLALDLVAQHFVLASQPEDARLLIRELATRFAWLVVPAPVVGGLAGFLAYRKLHTYQYPRLALTSTPEKAAQAADLTSLMLAASLPQLPSLLGDFSLILGAELTPVLCSTTLSTVMVLLIALLARPAPGT